MRIIRHYGCTQRVPPTLVEYFSTGKAFEDRSEMEKKRGEQ